MRPTLRFVTRWRTSPVVAVSAAAAAVVAVALALAPAPHPVRPASTASVRQPWTYADPGEVLAASDLVVAGTVVDARPGKTRGGAPDSPGSSTDRVLTLRVAEVLDQRHGTAVAVGDTVPVSEGWWRYPGVGVAADGVGWTPESASAVWFLHRVDGEDLYRTTDLSSRLLVDVPAGSDLPLGPAGLDPRSGPWHDHAPSDLDSVGEVRRLISGR